MKAKAKSKTPRPQGVEPHGLGPARWWRRPAGRSGTALVVFGIVAAGFWMIFDPFDYICRDPVRYYRLHSDDFAYIAGSRDLSRTLENLYVPHNTHIVPAWRIV